MHLNSLKHCIGTTSMTYIRPDQDLNPVALSFEPQQDRMGHQDGLVISNTNKLIRVQGGGPRVVVSTAAFHARVRGLVPGLGGFKESTCESQYCGEPPWPRPLGLRPPGLEFRILCLEDSVISIILPSSGGSLHIGGLKTDSFHFLFGLILMLHRIYINMINRA